MATSYADSVNALYLAYYGRPADPAGLAFWSQALEKNNGDLSAITDAFASSAEASARFSGESVVGRVNDIYQQLFNRAPDKAGLDYWSGLIQSGHLSMADAAIAIMNGGQSTDAQISTARAQAAAQFTATVAATGIAYDGIAAVQAARVLISAVTATTKPADISALVTASTSLVQTAHDNPAIIAALGNGADLSTLLTTASGKADPVAMVQALATFGKAALADSGGLNALLNGGGVTGLINSLPAGTSIKDVAAAVQVGGLYAGASVATPPPADTTPPVAAKLQLVTDTGVSATDHITRDGHVQISGIEAGATWAYSFDGKTWTLGPAADANGVAVLATSGDGDKTLQVRAQDAAGNISDTSTLQYTLKTAYVVTEAFKGPDGNPLPADATLSANSPNYVVYTYGSKGAASAQFQVSDTGADGSWTNADDSVQLKDGLHYIRYVFTDSAGNVANANALKLMMDTVAPAAPGVALVQDTGASATDGVTSNGEYQVTGLEPGATWEYSYDGKTWIKGYAADKSGNFYGYLFAGEQTVQVRAHDAAGNVSASTALHVTTDYTAPAAGLAFDHIGAAAQGVTTTALSKADVVFTFSGAVAATDTVEYETSANNQWTKLDATAVDAGARTITLHDLDLSNADPYITVRVTDLAGNATVSHGVSIDGPYTHFIVPQPISEAGLPVFSDQTAHVYLTDGANHSAQISSDDASGDAIAGKVVTLGMQATGVQGVLGLGTGIDGHTSIDATTYGLGSAGNDTLSGQYVWGYDGDDVINVTGTAAYNSGYVVGGAGGDTIHVETTSAQLVYTGAQDSHVVADGMAAHGFDTVYVSTDTAATFNEQFLFKGASILDGYQSVNATGYAGSDTGNTLLSMLTTALAPVLHASGTAQAGFVDVGAGADGKDVGFLVIDVNGDAVIDANDYVVKIVGNVDHSSITFTNTGIVEFHAGPAGH